MNAPDNAQQRLIRLTRGVAAAGTATLTALLFHVSSGGEVPGWLGIVIPFLFATLFCIFVASAKPSLPRLVISVVASQFLFHTLFVLGSGGGDSATTPLQLSHHGTLIGNLVASSSTNAPPVEPPDLAMWAGHAVAASLTIVALSAGDSLLRCLVRISKRLHAWWRAHLPHFPSPQGRIALTSIGIRREFVERRQQLMPVRRRGPPRDIAFTENYL
ncbi:hypothetical protein QYR02_01365 [Microbacterium maritypicum]|uniref:hypothetical protein n=1 Tax=Microbacterium maritypicum TaxID=33918 RepID=UPI00267362EA|nr:hypothetical protein [Microbacterium liquefaciens]WKT89588.1 hypothetical protein QYR02_01365 [Microbacterium liquefaciens]